MARKVFQNLEAIVEECMREAKMFAELAECHKEQYENGYFRSEADREVIHRMWVDCTARAKQSERLANIILFMDADSIIVEE